MGSSSKGEQHGAFGKLLIGRRLELDGLGGLGESDLQVVKYIYKLFFTRYCSVNLEVICHIFLTKISLIIICNILSAIIKESFQIIMYTKNFETRLKIHCR